MAKGPTKKTYVLEVKGPPPFTYVYGDVSYVEKEKSYKILVKRPRTSKLDEFIVHENTVPIAAEGESGYIYTNDPLFKTDELSKDAVNFTLNDGVVTPDLVSGVDDAGNAVSINRKLIDVLVRKAAYDV